MSVDKESIAFESIGRDCGSLGQSVIPEVIIFQCSDILFPVKTTLVIDF